MPHIVLDFKFFEWSTVVFSIEELGKFVECNLGICLEKTMTILKKFEGLLKNSSGFRSGLKE